MRKNSDYFFRQTLAVTLLAGVLWLTAQSVCARENAETTAVSHVTEPNQTNTVIECANNAYTETIFRTESKLYGGLDSSYYHILRLNTSSESAKDMILHALREKPYITNSVMESATINSTHTIFRVESNLAEDSDTLNDIFGCNYRYSFEADIYSNLIHNIGQLLGKWLLQVKDTLITSIAIYFAVQNLIFKKPKTQKAMVSLVTTSCFFCGIGYGLLTF